MQQIDNELDLAQQQLSQANTKLDDKDKALANVSYGAQPAFLRFIFYLRSFCFLFSFPLFGLEHTHTYALNVGRGGGSQSPEEDAAA